MRDEAPAPDSHIGLCNLAGKDVADASIGKKQIHRNIAAGTEEKIGKTHGGFEALRKGGGCGKNPGRGERIEERE